MRNIIKTTATPGDTTPYLLSKTYNWDYANIYLNKVTNITPEEGDGWYCPDMSSRCVITNVTRQVKRGNTPITVYEGYEGNFRMFFYWLGEYDYASSRGPGEYLTVQYSATTTPDSVAYFYNNRVVHCNVVEPHSYFNDIIPGVAYNPEVPYVFYNPKFPHIELTPGEVIGEREEMEIVGVFSYQDIGIDYEIVEDYQAAIFEGKTALEDFNIFVDGMPVSEAYYIGDCSCWGGQWFTFGTYGTFYKVHFGTMDEDEIYLLRGYTPQPG